MHETFAYDYVREPVYLLENHMHSSSKALIVYMFTIFDPTLGSSLNELPISKNMQNTRKILAYIDYKVQLNAPGGSVISERVS